MRRRARSGLLGIALVMASSFGYLACDESSAVKEAVPNTRPTPSGDAGPGDGGPTLPDGGSKDCFDNPKTHFEIINACTNATRITKNPTLPKLLPDGGLPPLN